MLDDVIVAWTPDAVLLAASEQGLRIGFTNGCFDILHSGHIRVLAEAPVACDRLVVGLNSDGSVARLKGDHRPVQSEQTRAAVLAALEAVDLVVIFEEDTPLELIWEVRPIVLVKGGDYLAEDVVGREVVEAAGGEVILVDLVQGHCTTRLLERSQASQTIPRAATLVTPAQLSASQPVTNSSLPIID